MLLVWSSTSANAFHSDDQIIIASSNALSGPARQLGLKLNQGASAYFSYINNLGGVAGKKVKYIQLDDGYEPLQTVLNTQELLSRKSIFALFNYVGTPTTHAILPLVEQHQVPLFTPFTGAEFLRDNKRPMVVNLRASYFEEAKTQIEYLVKQKKIERIGLLIQADEFGISAKKGYVNALEAFGLEPIVTTRYRRNTHGTALALSVLKDSEVDAVIFIGTYEPLAEFIKAGKAQDFSPYYTTLSFISSADLFKRLDTDSKVLVTEVFPAPAQCKKEICQLFRQQMKKAGFAQLDRLQLEGFLNAHLFIESAKACGENVSRACLVSQSKKLLASAASTKSNGVNAANSLYGLGGKHIYFNFFHKPN